MASNFVIVSLDDTVCAVFVCGKLGISAQLVCIILLMFPIQLKKVNILCRNKVQHIFIDYIFVFLFSFYFAYLSPQSGGGGGSVVIVSHQHYFYTKLSLHFLTIFTLRILMQCDLTYVDD